MVDIGSPVRVRFRAFTTRNSMKFSGPATIAKAAALETKTALLLIDHLKDYPNELPGQKYKRTFTLQRSWHATAPHFEPSGLTVNVYNDARETRKNGNGRYYAKYVQGAWQAEIHQGRWSRAEQGDVEELGGEDAFLSGLRREYRRELRGIIRSSIKFTSR